MTKAESTQKAIAALENAHTEIHRAIAALKEDALKTGKQKVVACIQKCSSALLEL